ncbi:MAG: hypothetical protein JSV99_06095, partial [Planctomycetota bacterium]
GGGDYDNRYCCKDCDAAAEGDGFAVESVFGGMRDEADAGGELPYDGGQDGRQDERAECQANS